MSTLFLVVWMTVNGQHVLTVQPMPAELCVAIRDQMRTTENVTAARCFSEAVTIDHAIQYSGCSPTQNADSFVNYTCRKGNPEWNRF